MEPTTPNAWMNEPDQPEAMTIEQPNAWMLQADEEQKARDRDLAATISRAYEKTPELLDTPEVREKMDTARMLAEHFKADPTFVFNNLDSFKQQYAEQSDKAKNKGDSKAITDDFEVGNLYVKKSQIDFRIKNLMDMLAFNPEKPNAIYGITQEEKDYWPEQKKILEAKLAEAKKEREEVVGRIPLYQDDRTRDWFTEARKTVLRSAPGLGDMAVKATIGAAATMATGGAAALSLGTSLAFAGIGATTGMVYSNAEQVGGDIYGQLVDAGSSHEVASQTANMGIFITSPLAPAQLNVATKVVDGPLSGLVSQAIIKSLGETSKQLASKRTAGAIAAKIAVDYSGRVAGQEILAATQSIVTDLSFNFGANLENELTNAGIEPRQIQEVVERAKQAMADSLITMAMIEGVPAVRMGLKAKKDLTGASNKIQAIMENAPQTDPALMKAVTLDIATGNPEARAQEFQARQADETTRSKVVTTDGQTMQVYHAGAEADGSIHFFENPEAAAERADSGNWSIRSDELVRAVQERYGRPSAEYIQGLIDGKRNLTAKVEADIPEATRLKIEEVAQYVDGIKKIPELVHDTIQELGIKAPETHILPAQIDAQSVIRTMDRSQVPELLKDYEAVILDGPDGAEVILKDPALAIVDSPLAVKNWRIPKENGRIISEDSGTAYHALDPNTKEKIATIGYDRMGDIAVIRDVPDNPRLAHELIQDFKAKNEKIILDLPPDTRDALARQNPERRAIAAEVNKLTAEQRAMENAFDADLEAASAADKAQVIDSYGAKANALQERMRAALDELDAVDQEYLGESKPDPLTTTREEIQQFAETRADRIDTAREELKARMIAEAPQIPMDELDASMQIIDVRAATMGLTPDQWIKRFMTNAEITNDVLNSGRAKGLVSFLDDGRAILKLSQKADAGTIVHELGHIVRRQLSDEDTKILADHYKTDANKPWTVEAEERFAEDFQRYFMENKRPPKGLEKVFATIQHFMKSLYAWLSGDLDQTVRGVIDRAFESKGDTLYQPTEKTLAEHGMEEITPSLIAMHNISVEQIATIPGFGGMPATSFAYTKPDIAHLGFGDATLILNKTKAIEIMKAGDLYDRDVWSPTVPKPEYKITQKKLDEFEMKLRKLVPHAETRNGSYGNFSNLENMSQGELSRGPKETAKWMERSRLAQIAYLRDTGRKFEIPQKEKPVEFAINDSKEFRDLIISEHMKENGGNDQEIIFNATRKNPIKGFGFNSDRWGSSKEINGHVIDQVYRDAKEAGKLIIDEKAMDKSLDSIIESEKSAYQKWLLDGIAPAYSAPRIKIGKEYLNFNAYTVMDWIKDQKRIGSQKGLTFGPARASSFAAEWLPTREKLRAEESKLVTEDQERAYQNEVLKPIQDMLQEELPKYTDLDTWDALDSIYKGIAKYLKAGSKTPAAMKSALSSAGFKSVPAEIISQAVDLAKKMVEAPQNYFEGKASEVLKLNDFTAAVIPETSPAESKKALADSGVKVYEYKTNDERTAIIKDISTKELSSDVLFQPADPTDSPAFKEWFGESKVVDEQGKPLVVYHGTRAENIDAFSPEKRGQTDSGYAGKGYYFHWDKSTASSYGHNQIPVYLSAKKIFDFNEQKDGFKTITDSHGGVEGFTKWLIDNGYDGAKLWGQYMVLNPEQVKSINNRGTWNPQDPRLLYATDRLDPARLDDLMGQVSKLEARRFDMIQGFDDPAKMPEVDRQIAELKGQADDYRLAMKADAQKATAAGEYVSRQTLEQFTGEQWADDALDQLDMEAAMDFSEDAFEAIEPDTIANLDRELADEQNATGNYETVPERIEPMTRAEANKAWQALIDEKGESILDQIRGVYKDRKGLTGEDLEHFREISWGGPVNKAIMVSRYEKIGPVRAEAIKHLRENGDVYREKWARFNQDWEGIQESNRIDQAEPLPTTAADQAKIKALSVEDRIQHIRDMVRTGMKDRAAGEIDTTYTEVSKELTRLTLANKAQMGKIQELDSRISSMISAKMKLDNKLDYAEKDLAKAETASNRDQKTIEELKARRDQLKAEKSTLAAEWKDKFQAEHEALMSARKEARALQEFTAEQVKAKYQQRDQLRRLREYKTDLMRRIMKKPGDSINFDEAEAIRELQASLDPDSHGMKYQAKRDGMRKWFAEHPDMFKALNVEIQDMITKLSKDELTIDQLEGLNTQVERLKEIGRIKRQMVKEARRQAMLQDVADLTTAVLNGQEFDPTDPKMRKNGGSGGTLAEAVRDATTPQALMDKLDGGMDYQGTWMKRVWNKVSDTWAASREGINRRMDTYTAKVKELQIDPVELNRQKHVILDRAIQTDATKDKAIMSRWLTLQEAMGVYMANQMEDGQKALRDGFRLTESDIAKVIDSVPANYKQLADWIIDHGYGDHTERLRRATIDYTNQDMALIDRYSPILRFEDDGSSLDKQIVDDLMRDTPAGNKYVACGMTKARTMTGKFQKPMRLDCLDIFREMVEKQEHFMHMGEQVRHFNSVFRNTDLRAAITVAHGEGWAKQLDGWIQRVANPDLFAAKTSESRLARAIRNNAAMAYLGFRIPTALKAWITGPMYSMAEAPVELAANLAKTGYGLAIPVTKKLYARMVKLAPEMEARTISRPYAEMQRANAKKFVRLHMVESHAYDMLTWGQRFTDAVTWNAVLDKNIKAGMDEKVAAREATNYILRTQPVGDAKDQSAMGANKGFASVLTQFMSQGNQLWNDMSLVRTMQTLKNKNASPKAKQAMARKLGIQIAGVVMAGTIYSLFSMKKMPETEEDWQKLAFETANGQLTTMLPWIGGAASAGFSGFGYDLQVMTPVTGLATGAKTTADMMGALANGEDITGKQVANTIKALSESAAIIMGKPYLAPKQIVDAAGNQIQTPDMTPEEVAASWAQYLILGGKAK